MLLRTSVLTKFLEMIDLERNFRGCVCQVAAFAAFQNSVVIPFKI